MQAVDLTITPRTLNTLKDPEYVLQVLNDLYGQHGRFYHTLEHIQDLLTKLKDIRATELGAVDTGVCPPETLELAILFHDAVYVPGSLVNEDASADLAVGVLSTASYNSPEEYKNRFRWVNILIRATKFMQSTSEANLTQYERLIQDLDFSILGAPELEYRAYATKIRMEFLRQIPEEQYNVGRKAFLQHMLLRAQHGTLFKTTFYDALNTQAASNFQVELDILNSLDVAP